MIRFFLAVVLLAGCTEASLKPEDPVWGKQQCAHCAMLVSEKPPAAQVVTSDGKRRFFDDVGCMVAWEDRESPKVSARWVRDPSGTGWVDPATTHFSAGHPTPMDFGFLPDAAGVITFELLRTAVREKARRPPPSEQPP
jgi:nitrous oxide reductase accessory protein NosL